MRLRLYAVFRAKRTRLLAANVFLPRWRANIDTQPNPLSELTLRDHFEAGERKGQVKEGSERGKAEKEQKRREK